MLRLTPGVNWDSPLRLDELDSEMTFALPSARVPGSLVSSAGKTTT
jgi:hypothetical protein